MQEWYGLFGAIAGFVAATAAQLVRDRTEDGRRVAAERRADRRALRDAKLARMRRAFEPLMLATWGLQTAASEVIHSSAASRASSEEMLREAMRGLNEARVQLKMERDISDVFDAFERLRAAYSNLRLNVYDEQGRAPSDEIAKDWTTIKEKAALIETLTAEHIRRVEASV